ncbi:MULTISPECIES: HPr kinase/phosphorylase [Pacificibacter]|uniref:HPr kinase/phosphorylase n=1 Tax=Pacificibacter TaxID=1042323 RepID=UPI0020912E6D|nr:MULTISPECIES: HPr kinase/phosphatase C-terminal domain-containing protein [Pacificibacter]MDO6615362.1 HPr kinase/phosphatase C-terminal domain-containing protein [Pacificibacter sp. 1_MG-2023]
MMKPDPHCDIIHASCVAIDPSRGLLIVGASGSGKSSLALMMMALGAILVSDDRTQLSTTPDGGLVASAPKTIKNMIEARGIGVLKAQTMPQCVIRAVVDLGKVEQDRLPPARIRRLLDLDIPEYHRSDSPYFAAALIQLLKEGRIAPQDYG